MAEREFGGDIRERIAGRLARECRRTRQTRVHFDDVILSRVNRGNQGAIPRREPHLTHSSRVCARVLLWSIGIDGILNVALADDA